MFRAAFFSLKSFPFSDLIGLVLLLSFVSFCLRVMKRYSALKGREGCSFTKAEVKGKRIRHLAFIPLFIEYSYSFTFGKRLYKGRYVRLWSKKDAGLELFHEQTVKLVDESPEINCLAIDEYSGSTEGTALCLLFFVLLFLYFLFFSGIV